MCENEKKKYHSIEMTTGSLWKNILLFSLPLMGSQVLEVLFNLSDVAVVGRFADYMALGAVGSTTLLVTLFTGILIGMGAGVNVRVAHELGAGNKKGTEETIHTSLLLCAITGLLVCAICLLFSGRMLSMMNTKPELIDQAILYMKIYSLGMPAMAVYYVSASLVMIHLLRRTDDCKVSLRKICLHPKACKAVLMLGIPTGLQNGIFAIANLFVQTGVNSFDAVMVSGNAAAANADSLIYNVMFSFYTACASFIGQNWGAGNKKRMLKSYRVSLTYAFIFGAILGGLLLVFGPQFLSLFATEPTVIDAGMQRIRIMAFSYAFSCFMDGSIAASRGIGKSIPPTIIVILGSCVFRIVWIYTVFAHFQTISSLYLLYIFSWGITGLAETLFFVVSFNIIYSKNSPSSIGGR